MASLWRMDIRGRCRGRCECACACEREHEGVIIAVVAEISSSSPHPRHARASHIFSVNQFRSIVQTVVHSELLTLHTLLRTISTSSSPHLALPDLFFRYTLSSFASIAFGADIGCLTSSPTCLDHQVPFSVAFDAAQEHINKRLVKPGWQVIEKFNQGGKDMREWVKTIRGFALGIIDKRLDEGKRERRDSGSGMGEEAKKKDLLGLAMELTKEREVRAA